MPKRVKALATRSSKMFSNLSHCPVARSLNWCATCVTLWVASASFSSAVTCALRCMVMPSFTSFSNALVPSCCALENAPKPANQICCACSLTLSAIAAGSRWGCLDMVGAFFKNCCATLTCCIVLVSRVV